MNKTRLSNIELLRIISMIMILCVHFTGATFGLPDKMQVEELSNLPTVSKILMESISIIGVNCFILISGYFGIKPSIKGIINFILWCMFYAVGIYALVAIIQPTSYNTSALISSFRVLSHTDLWFVPAYFALYIISPILNKGVSSISKRNFQFLIFGLTFLNVYLGWFWEGKINPNGYNVMQMIYIYMIGRYISAYASTEKRHKSFYLTTYMVSLLLIFSSTFYCHSNMAFAYNSPFVVVASISFFMIFTTFSFESKRINYIASSAFAVYLIHKMPPIWSTLRDFLFNTSINMDYFSFSLYYISFIIIVFIICIAIDKVRMTVMNPVIDNLSSIANRFI